MNKKTAGIGLLVLGLALMVVFNGRLTGSIPGIVFMVIGIVLMKKEIKIGTK
jgi:hypothetical protein